MVTKLKREGIKDAFEALFGHPIYIATYRTQKRHHRKKRLDKKYARRYGYYEYDLIPQGTISVVNGLVYITYHDYNELKKVVRTGRKVVFTTYGTSKIFGT